MAEYLSLQNLRECLSTLIEDTKDSTLLSELRKLENELTDDNWNARMLIRPRVVAGKCFPIDFKITEITTADMLELTLNTLKLDFIAELEKKLDLALKINKLMEPIGI